jgi:hypothetical protein
MQKQVADTSATANPNTGRGADLACDRGLSGHDLWLLIAQSGQSHSFKGRHGLGDQCQSDEIYIIKGHFHATIIEIGVSAIALDAAKSRSFRGRREML